MRNFIYAIILLAMCSLARASVFEITGAPYFDGTHFVSPYQGLLDGNAVSSFCLEYTHQVGFNTPFDVTVVNLHNFTGAQHDNFWQVGWIALQIANVTDVTILSAASRAIWLITTPGTTDPYLTTDAAFSWVLQAQQNCQSVSDTSFTLLLRSGDPGQAQLIIGVPEPATVACVILLGASMLFFLCLGRRQRAGK